MKNNILIIAPPFKILPTDGYGAVEKITIARGKALKQAGYSVSYIAPRGSKIAFADEIFFVNPIKPFGFKMTDRTRFVDQFDLGMLRFFREFSKLKKGLDFDVIINDFTRSDPFNLYNFHRILGSLNRIDILHGNTKIALIFRRPKKFLSQTLGVLNTRLHEKLSANGWISAYFPNGIEFPNKDRILQEPDDQMIFIGRFAPFKGAHDAIRIASMMKSKIYLFGWIQDADYFEKIIKPLIDSVNVIFMGNQKWEIVVEYLRKSKALLFCSNYSDPQPTVLLEAISYGVPILGVKPGFYSGYFDICDESNSVVCDFLSDPKQWAAKLNSLDRLEIYKRAKDKWSWERVVDGFYKEVFAQLPS